jgi:hemoglobin
VSDPVGEEVNVFEAVGGRPFFDALVDRFYADVADDPVLRPLYPDDLTASKAHLAGFLAQYWGGGMEQYSAERGHPRLRMRHVRFAIGRAERDAWYRHMADAVVVAELPAELEAQMLGYFAMAADHLVNATD